MTASAAVAAPAVAAPGDVLNYATVARGPWPARRAALHDWVRRPRLVRRLQDPGAPPLAVLVAPAGYGKTALLREWAERDRRPFAWVVVDERDNHGARLSAKVARALATVQPEGGTGPVVLVLDDLHLLQKPAALDALGAIVGNLGPEVTLALSSRSRLTLPIARFREQRLVTELGPRDLAMTRSEAALLLRLAGLELDRDGVETLLRRTEGWPAGLSLAALALDERTGPAVPSRFGGEDRLVAEYLRDEILGGLSAEQLEFVLRTSVLDTLTGSLCDAVLGRSGSAATLSALAGSNLLLVALDRTDERYRYHRLFSEMLRAELHRREPELEPELHRRAGAWHRRAGDLDRALHHAICGGDIAGAGELVWSGVVTAVGHGHKATIESWLGRFTDVQIAAHPTLALAAATSQLARGQGDLVEHWASAAAATADRPDAVEAGIAVMRAALARDGIARMEEDAAQAYRLEPEDSPWRSLCCMLAGTAQLVVGRSDEAVRQLEEGTRRAAVAAPDVHALCLAQLGVLSLMEEDWEEAAGLITRARSQVDRHGLAGSATVALVFAASALVRASPRARRRRAERPPGRDPAAVHHDGFRSVVRRRAGDPDRARRRPAQRCQRGSRSAAGSVTAHAPRARGGRPRSLAARRVVEARRIYRSGQRSVVGADPRGASHPPVPPDTPLIPRDRRAHLRLGEHHQVASERRVPQAQRLLPFGGGRPSARDRVARRMSRTTNGHSPGAG